jgi:hypothetical protein
MGLLDRASTLTATRVDVPKIEAFSSRAVQLEEFQREIIHKISQIQKERKIAFLNMDYRVGRFVYEIGRGLDRTSTRRLRIAPEVLLEHKQDDTLYYASSYVFMEYLSIRERDFIDAAFIIPFYDGNNEFVSALMIFEDKDFRFSVHEKTFYESILHFKYDPSLFDFLTLSKNTVPYSLVKSEEDIFPLLDSYLKKAEVRKYRGNIVRVDYSTVLNDSQGDAYRVEQDINVLLGTLVPNSESVVALRGGITYFFFFSSGIRNKKTLVMQIKNTLSQNFENSIVSKIVLSISKYPEDGLDARELIQNLEQA